jgi:hypothetical protein
MAKCIAALAAGLLCYSGAASAQDDLLWAKGAGGASADKGKSISAHVDGTSVVTGEFSGTATFGAQVLTSAGGSDIFVARYAADGSLLWVKQAGGG